MPYSSLTELVRRKGGVKDFGGELADMLGGKTVRKVRKKTGRAHYARSGRGIVRRKGMDLDDMRHVAIEEGFLPEGADINALLDALGDESRGRVHRSRFEDVEIPERVYVEPKKRKPEPPTIPAHESVTKKCRRCGQPHGKKAHRFHGKGSYVRTHKFLKYFEANPAMTISKAKQYVTYYTGLIRQGMALVKEERDLLIRARQLMRRARRPAVNPRRKRRVIRRNCNPPGATVVYHRLLRIEARKGPGHRCDAGCKRANHSYFHDFGPGAVVYGLPDGSLVIRQKGGKRLWKFFN